VVIIFIRILLCKANIKWRNDGKHIHAVEEKNNIALGRDIASDVKEECSSLF
jgi:hypothetical protein